MTIVKWIGLAHMLWLIIGMFPTILAASSFNPLVHSIAFALVGSILTRFLSNRKILFGFKIILAPFLGYCECSIAGYSTGLHPRG
jgi:hypothetical protein